MPYIASSISLLSLNFVKNAASSDNPLKCEYYLPAAVKEAMDAGATVKVLKTGAKWFGVTYREDRKAVVSSIGSLSDVGEYPCPLWRGSILVTGGGRKTA